MRRKVKRIPEERAIKIATEYLTTDLTIKELQLKYGFKGNGNIHRWIRNFGLSEPTEEDSASKAQQTYGVNPESL